MEPSEPSEVVARFLYAVENDFHMLEQMAEVSRLKLEGAPEWKIRYHFPPRPRRVRRGGPVVRGASVCPKCGGPWTQTSTQRRCSACRSETDRLRYVEREKISGKFGQMAHFDVSEVDTPQ